MSRLPTFFALLGGVTILAGSQRLEHLPDVLADVSGPGWKEGGRQEVEAR